MASTDYDVLLGRVLPHVQTGVIHEAQRSILDCVWDDSDSLDQEDLDLVPRSVTTPSRQSLTNSTSDLSYAGRSGGLSPPRRLAAFADFDDAMAADIKPDNIRSVNKHLTSTFVHAPADLGHPDSRPPPHSIVSSASSLRHQRRMSSPIPPPPRSSSSRMGDKQADHAGLATLTGAQNAPQGLPVAAAAAVSAATADKPLPPLKEGSQLRSNLVLDDDDDDYSDEEGGRHELASRGNGEHAHPRNGIGHPSSSTASYGAESSTPPPIASVRPTRMVVYDDFDEEDPLNGFETHDKPPPVPEWTENALYQDARKPPVAYRGKDKRLDSLTGSSDRSRSAAQYAHAHAQGSAGTAMHSRMAPLAASYRDLRTPVLDHVQLYHDAEAKKPLFDPTTEGRAQRHASQKPRRIQDDSTVYHTSGGGGHLGPPPGSSAGATGALLHDTARNGGSLPLRRAFSDDEVSVRHSISGRTVASVGSQNMPDFFTASVFQVVLHNPTTAYRLLKFSESRLCAENVEFLAKVDAYRTTLNDLAGQMSSLHKTYISPGSPSQINVNGAMLKRAHKEMRSLVSTVLPAMENLFTELQEQIENLVFQDVYPRFVRHQMTLSASRALGSDRFKYQGLGDCFCLTNPSIADNPIVFASDGFVKVTGYTRPEIVPRNCRFLQGAHTDRQAVARLRNAIYEQKESVELLLNYKKNGDPFWNLLYTVPLFNTRGKCEFFLGGQVNCSTTIHSNVDVMKVLSMSDQPETDEGADNHSQHARNNGAKSAGRSSARRTFLKALGVWHEDNHLPVPQGDAGMENGVLGRMEGQDLSRQMKEFYTAYSKFLVVRASTWVIEFYSEGVVEALNPANMASSMVAGSDVFRFLSLHMLAKQPDYKARVRNAIRSGIPVSISLRLQTKRSAVFRGDEAFVAHWTPLKDEKAAVHWVIITLAPMQTFF